VRRNRTVQRERLLEILRSTDTHPSAADLFEGLRAEFPRISLGTVYRNLEVLVCEGSIEQVPSRSGVMRYDANPRPHHHFVCESCGDIRDLDIRLPRALAARLERRYKLRAERIRADFFGLCESCSDRES
jgi:Fe2+ or Zn2+ uptake regulation protein